MNNTNGSTSTESSDRNPLQGIDVTKLQEAGQKLLDRVTQFTQENPKLATGLGLAAGLLLARRLFRR
jgi:hypothetical protein